MFGLTSREPAGAAAQRRGPGWFVMASAGDRPPDGPAAEVSLPVTGTVTLAGQGRTLSGDDARLLSACAVPMVAGLIRRHQDELNAHAARQATDSRSRSSLLAATGQQAREQLEKADAALAVLADPAAVITPDERTARAADARRAVARIGMLLTDLNDLRRLQTGALETYLRPVDLDEVLAAALEDLGPGGPELTLSVPEDLPDVIADADLLTRILTGLIAEALHRSPLGHPPALTVASQDGRAEIRITDHGPPQAQGSEPDTLGFRLARDLAEAMGDALRCSKNPDGGRTVLITLLAAAASGSRPQAAAHH